MYKGNQEHQFFACLPIQETNTFDGQFGFIQAEASLNAHPMSIFITQIMPYLVSIRYFQGSVSESNNFISRIT